jgi:phage gp46-like protein
MGDIRFVFDNLTGTGDWAMDGRGLATGHEIETAIMISLFSDAQADPGDIVRDADPRGWWADTYSAHEDPNLTPIADDRTGSKLWQVFNMPRTQQTLNWMANQILVALEWMKIDGVADAIDAAPRFTNSGGVGAIVVITRGQSKLTYNYAWAAITGFRDPGTPPPGTRPNFTTDFSGDFR